MTLYKKLLTWSVGIFITLSLVLSAIEFSNTRTDLIEQQTKNFTQTLHAATFALSPYLESNNTEHAETIIRSIFNNGEYKSVKLVSVTEGNADEFKLNVNNTKAPSWFVSLAHIEPMEKSIQIKSKWQTLAYLKVTYHPTFIYQELWDTSKSIFFAVLLSGVILIFALSLIFKKILSPLKDIQLKAKTLSNNNFDEISIDTKYQELNDVVSAFNLMTQQLRRHFEQQTEEAEKLRIRAYQDPISGLANRKYIMTQLASWIESSASGGIALLKVDQIEDVYEKEGYQQGDDLTRQFSALLKDISSEEFNIARLNRSEFMLLAPNTPEDDMMEIGRAILNMAASLQHDPLDIAPIQAALAIVMKQDSDTMSTLLARADNGLAQARTNRKTPLFFSGADSDNAQPSFGKQQWQKIVDEAIANKSFVFNYQKAINRNNGIIHQEVFASIQKGEERYSAGHFLNAIESLDKGSSFDMHIIDEVFAQIKKYNPKYPIAVNLTQSSINDTGFMRWLGKKLESTPEYADKVLFELPEMSFIKQPDNTELLCNIITNNNYKFGIDNFGHNFGSIGYLNAYRPDYVKLDFAYTSQIDNNEKADVVFSIARTAANLSITTIASRVETMAQKNKLIELELQGFQGYITEQINSDSEGQV